MKNYHVTFCDRRDWKRVEVVQASSEGEAYRRARDIRKPGESIDKILEESISLTLQQLRG